MTDYDYIEAYRIITKKLKKRYLKPNYKEAAVGYKQIAQLVKREGNVQFAAFCMLAVARCHESMKNHSMYALEIKNSGGLFWDLAKDPSVLDITDFKEYQMQAEHCYLMAIKIYHEQEKFIMCSTLYFELAECLQHFNRYKEAGIYFLKAADLQHDITPMSSLQSVQRAFSCSMQYGKENSDFTDATQHLQYIIKLATEQAHETNSQFFDDIRIAANVTLKDFEQARGVLLTIKEHTLRHQRVEGVANIFTSNEWFFLMLETVVDAYEKKDVETVIAAHTELSQVFTEEQNDVYITLIEDLAS